jgi:nicotinamidase-related amidase
MSSHTLPADAAAMALVPERAVLVVVDVQERLSAAMEPAELAQVERNVCILIELARQLDIPVVASEQYPRGLGPTREPIAQALSALEGGLHRFEKLEFSVCRCDAFAKVFDAIGGARTQFILAGMETHVCVYQSARDLRARGLIVHVPADAVISRADANRRLGLGLMERAGAVITSTETLVFDALGRAGTDAFKAMSRLVR